MGKHEISRKIPLPIKLCCFYDTKDEMYCSELLEHLTVLKRQGLLEIWNPREMLPGVIQGNEIDNRLSSSNIVLLLLSRYFFNSDPHWDIMERALKLYYAHEIHIVPVSARPYDYESTPLGVFQIIPRKKPLSLLNNRDEGYVEVVKGIRQVILSLQDSGEKESKLIRPEMTLETFSLEQELTNSSLAPSLFVEKGDILFKHQRYDEALRAYEDALYFDATYIAAYQGKMQVFKTLASLTYEKLSHLTVQSSERTKPQNDTQEDLE